MLNGFLKWISRTPVHRWLAGGLAVMAAWSILLGFLSKVSFSGTAQLLSLAILLPTCLGLNWLAAKALRLPLRHDSTLITAFILFFLMIPPASLTDAVWLLVAALIAIVTKYLVVYNKRPIFNPAALAAVAVGLTPGAIVLWWVGTPWLVLPSLIVGGVAARKLRLEKMVLVALAATLATVSVFAWHKGVPVPEMIWQQLVSWPTIFFLTVMVTEPKSMPAGARLRLVYGAFIGLLANWPFFIGPFYSSPELALVIANLVFLGIGSWLWHRKQATRAQPAPPPATA
jgi:Na+-translocating ferredoxin:NAD+ oxidoreductase RnfD subunit